MSEKKKYTKKLKTGIRDIYYAKSKIIDLGEIKEYQIVPASDLIRQPKKPLR